MASIGPSSVSRRQLLDRYRSVREDHLRYMEKWGIVRPEHRDGDAYYTFADLAIVRQADADLAEGVNFRAVLRSLFAARSGQLTFDFRLDAQPAKVIRLKRPDPPPMVALLDVFGADTSRAGELSSAEQYFMAGSALDDGDPANVERASRAYRCALEIDPYLVPAVINLANIHYSRDEIAEAQALYERAIALDPDVFEARFNLGNILHDLGRFAAAQMHYRDALKLNPVYADAHFYLAVTLEKNGQSREARPHWRAYQQLAPDGEWVELAKDFSD